jgi:hypothetical protein
VLPSDLLEQALHALITPVGSQVIHVILQNLTELPEEPYIFVTVL